MASNLTSAGNERARHAPKGIRVTESEGGTMVDHLGESIDPNGIRFYPRTVGYCAVKTSDHLSQDNAASGRLSGGRANRALDKSHAQQFQVHSSGQVVRTDHQPNT